MYTRTYTDEGGGILIPESYGGTALTQKAKKDESEPREEGGKNPWESQQADTEPEVKSSDSVQASAEISKSRVPAFLSNIFKNGNFSLQNIGAEEILILATAAFLLFSREGDKECAIMLLLLLFLG